MLYTLDRLLVANPAQYVHACLDKFVLWDDYTPTTWCPLPIFGNIHVFGWMKFAIKFNYKLVFWRPGKMIAGLAWKGDCFAAPKLSIQYNYIIIYIYIYIQPSSCTVMHKNNMQ